jgi:glucan phosphorylase
LVDAAADQDHDVGLEEALAQAVMFDLLDHTTRDSELRDRVIVLDNYNIWDAPKLFQGVDATIMLADDGREASATGFMKAQANGALVLACHDGAIPESVFYEGPEANGFLVPYVDGQPRPEGLLNAFESLARAYANPEVRARMSRAAFAACGQISIDRTAKEMIELYASL